MTGTPLSGTTRLYAVLGDPVTQVRAPELVNPVLAALGVDAVVVPVHAPAEHLAAVVGGLVRAGNVDGLLVTVPHKAAVCALADELGPAAALSGTANAMRRGADGRWLADNFDGLGFVRGLEAAGHPVRGRRVVLVGAGGAGSAVAVALLMAGAGPVCVRDVDEGRLAGLLARLGSRWPRTVRAEAPGDLAAADLVVNATPLGMRPGDPLPFDPAAVRADAVVADIVMKPHETALLRAAAAAGRRVHHGVHMLEQQVPCYREFFGWP
ncbi:shikimate dehydrogenase [Streptomyces griseoviridis]|uniref:Shikimate dehydrogenase n=2 Tax=Streptomyces griseoviridis TaxID=45398 RepID=A0ABT9L969_STRGD|nr:MULTISPECIES: shikimate dehydrogenase [Streptomyces]MDP9680245.1 shikimate dehydrogenase [Streptomyces griseoviridis]GGS50192.1 shikimate dehydrogenase [Streptomyces niveoruber]GGT13719.1 shikimate dehydrogenase [Streptomyces griseoviridis]